MLNIDWKPSKKNNIPIYRQITDYIKNKITNGEWPIGTILPPQREMARYFQVNRSTISIAIDELNADGLIESKLGSGTKIINNTCSLLKTTSPPDWKHYIETGIHQPNFPVIQEINKLALHPGIINLYKGEISSKLYSPELMQKVLSNIPNRTNYLGYTEPKGLLFLREKLSTYLKSHNINASPSSILIVSGALQGLQLIAFGLLQEDREILLEKPSYFSSLTLFQSAGINLRGIPFDTEGINLSSLAYQQQQHPGSFLFTIPCFHNPTGTLMSLQRRKDLITLCEKEKLPIIEDDVYRELWLDSPPPPPLKSYDKHGLVIYIGSLSKSLYPGLRIGWIVGPEPVINRLADIKMQIDYGTSSLSQWVAADWFDSGYYEQHLKNMRAQLRARRKICLDILERHFKDIATWNMPLGGFYIWLTLNAAVSMSKLFKNALKSGLLIAPGNLYDHSLNKQIRLCYCYLSVSELRQGLPRLALVIRDLMIHSNK